MDNIKLCTRHVRRLLTHALPFDLPIVERVDTENKVLECRAKNGRIMLVALSELIDPYEVERMNEKERLEELGELDRAAGFCTKDENDRKEVQLSDCLMCKFCLPPEERIYGKMCKFNETKKIIFK